MCCLIFCRRSNILRAILLTRLYARMMTGLIYDNEVEVFYFAKLRQTCFGEDFFLSFL